MTIDEYEVILGSLLTALQYGEITQDRYEVLVENLREEWESEE